MDCSPPGSSIHGILQAIILEWVAISFSRGSSRPRDWTWVSCIAGRCFNLWATREAPTCLRAQSFPRLLKMVVANVPSPQDSCSSHWPSTELEVTTGFSRASLVAQMVKNLPPMRETLERLGKCPGGGHGNPLQYSCLENPRGHRGLAGHSPWGCKELDGTQWLSTAHTPVWVTHENGPQNSRKCSIQRLHFDCKGYI